MIKVAENFSNYLVNRNPEQGDGSHNGIQFRNDFLQELESDTWWSDKSKKIILDFKDVITLAPSWANEVFAYYTQLRRPELIYEKIEFKNLSRVKRAIIELEVSTGYNG